MKVGRTVLGARRLLALTAILGTFATASTLSPPAAGAVVPAPPTLPYILTLGGPGACPAGSPTCGHAKAYPSGGDVDPQGVVYTADTGNDQVEAWNPDGSQAWRVGSRGPGYKNPGRFQNPRDLAYADGKVYVADLGNNRVQVLDAVDGHWLATWGTRFSSLIGISAGVDETGARIILTANDIDGVIRTYTPDGVLQRTIGTKCTPPLGKQCSLGLLAGPRDAATDVAGNVYVADYANNRIQEFTPTGASVLRAWGAKGTGDGQFNRPYGVSVDDAGLVYVADSDNGRLQKFSAQGAYLSQYGSQVTNNVPGLGQFFALRRVAVGTGVNPKVYGFDLWGSAVQRFDQAGTAEFTYAGVAPADGAFNEVFGVDATPTQVFAADTDNQRMQRFGADGAWQLTWGQRGFGESNLGYNWPRDIAYSAAKSTVWVADTKNNRVTEFDPSGVATGRKIGTVQGSTPDKLWWPYAVAASGTADRVAVADTNNNRVSLWDPAVATAPVWSVSAAAGLNLKAPKDVTFGTDPVLGDLVYVTDSVNQRVVRLRVSDGSVVDVLAPTTATGVKVLHQVEGIAVDSRTGRMWVADTSFNRLVELSATGALIKTIGKAGTLHGQFNNPTHLAIATTGATTRLYVTDTWNDRVEVFDISTS